MNNKQILISAGIAFAFLIILAGGILVFGSQKTKEGNDMAAMHAPPAPADNTRFKSLIGSSAPEFSLKSFDGKTIDLAGLKGKNVVLFFSEGAMCYPSCWDQINEFTKDAKKFADKNTVVLTVVVDPKTNWAEAVRKDPKLGNAMILLDSDKKVSGSYGVLTIESSMHRGQYPGHTYVIIDKEGVIRYEYDDVQMGIRNFELLSELNKLV